LATDGEHKIKATETHVLLHLKAQSLVAGVEFNSRKSIPSAVRNRKGIPPCFRVAFTACDRRQQRGVAFPQLRQNNRPTKRYYAP